MSRLRNPAFICAIVLLATLTAGLLPFQKPRNGVTWLGNMNGLRFRHDGTIFSDSAIPAAVSPEEHACSIELWLQPASLTSSKTILAFYTPENPLQLTLHQYRTLLILERRTQLDPDRARVIGIENAFRSTEPVFLTITSGDTNSAMYVNGALARSFPGFRFGEDCHGELIVGTSPTTRDTWHGQLKGFALYRHELTPAEVLETFQSWTTRGQPNISNRDRAIAVYLFKERSGSIIHNELAVGADLSIPEHFTLWRQLFLEPFWREYKPGLDYWSDVLINIAGFMPLGFVFCAAWTYTWPRKRPVLITVLFGFAVSLTIEVLQSYLPTRDSGTTDLITNALGTYLGVRLCAWKIARDLWMKIFGG
jgi:VanZ family protein